MVVNDKLNLTMLCDFYELTMGAGYFANGYTDRITYFDLFFRRCPDGGGFAIAAGLEQIVQYIQKLHFDTEDIAYLRERKCFSEDFLNYLANFKFHRRHLGGAGGNAHFPPGADHHRPRACHSGAAC